MFVRVRRPALAISTDTEPFRLGRLRGDARGRDGGLREELAAGVAPTGRLLFALTEYLFYSLHDWYFEILFIAAIIFHLAHIFIQDF